MILYLSIIFLAMVIIVVANCLYGGLAFDNYIIWTIVSVTLSVVVEIIIDLIFAGLIHALPNRWFARDKKCFQVSRKERKFYEKLNIKAWKDKVVELGALGGFRKNKIREKDSPEYLDTFIIESNKGIVIHLVGIVVGFAVMFILPLKYFVRIGLWVSIVNVILNILPTMILRYNIPKLQVAYERARRLSSGNRDKDESKQ